MVSGGIFNFENDACQWREKHPEFGKLIFYSHSEKSEELLEWLMQSTTQSWML